MKYSVISAFVAEQITGVVGLIDLFFTGGNRSDNNDIARNAVGRSTLFHADDLCAGADLLSDVGDRGLLVDADLSSFLAA